MTHSKDNQAKHNGHQVWVEYPKPWQKYTYTYNHYLSTYEFYISCNISIAFTPLTILGPLHRIFKLDNLRIQDNSLYKFECTPCQRSFQSTLVLSNLTLGQLAIFQVNTLQIILLEEMKSSTIDFVFLQISSKSNQV